jgi:hypothetical protein
LWDRIRRFRHDLGAVAFLIAATTAVFADVVFGMATIFIRDLTRYYYPTKRIIREVVLSGEFPFWNPYYSAGQPMAANPEYAVFYPLQWLIFLPDYDLGYRLHIVVHLWLTAVGMYLLLRSTKAGIRASTLGALGWALGGTFLSYVNLLPILFCAAWIPWIFLFAHRFFDDPNRRDYALVALMLGVQMLTAEPTTLVQTWFLLGCYGLYRGWYASRRWRAMARNTGMVALMGIGGLAVGSLQMFPALDHVGDSVRSRAFDFNLVSAWSMPFARPLELFFPQLFGHVFRDGPLYWGTTLYTGTGSPFIFNLHPGILLVLFGLGAIFARPRGARVMLFLATLSYVLALGANTPLLRWLYDLGVANSIRYLEKFTLIGIFVFTVFAALMADRALRGDGRLLRGAAFFAGLLFLVSLGAAVFSLTPGYPAAFRHLWGLGDTELGRRMVDASMIDWWIAAARGAVVLAVLELVRRQRMRLVASLVVGALITLDAWYLCQSVLPREVPRFFTPPEVVEQFDPDRNSYRLFHEADWYGSTPLARSYFGAGGGIYWVVRNGVFPMTPATWGFRTVLERDYDKTALLPTVDLLASMWQVRDKGQKNWATMYMSMSNARFRAAYRPFEEVRDEVGGDWTRAQPIQFTRGRDWPRFYFADQLIKVAGTEEFIEKLVAGEWTERSAYVGFEPFAPAAGEVLEVEERFNSIRLQVRAAGEAYLVLSVTPHKYWRAWLVGKEVPLAVTNIGYQGLRVPAGEHEIRLEYRNRVVMGTAPLALGSSLLFMVMAALPRRRRAAAGPAGAEASATAETGV